MPPASRAGKQGGKIHRLRIIGNGYLCADTAVARALAAGTTSFAFRLDNRVSPSLSCTPAIVLAIE